jgi:hypothetical protein
MTTIETICKMVGLDIEVQDGGLLIENNVMGSDAHDCILNRGQVIDLCIELLHLTDQLKMP